MKISEFLKQMDSHTIYDNGATEREFRAKTGFEPNWPTYTQAETEAIIRHSKAGGQVEKGSELLCYGYEIAESLAEEHAEYRRYHTGRGFRFLSAIQALEAKGL